MRYEGKGESQVLNGSYLGLWGNVLFWALLASFVIGLGVALAVRFFPERRRSGRSKPAAGSDQGPSSARPDEEEKDRDHYRNAA